jgi:hypothetical protein
VDFVQRDAENRRLGRMGEEWTLTFEERRLHDVERRPDLAKRVEWVAETRGVTANELRVSQREAASYQLYRVFSFAKTPRVYMLPGDLQQTCRLEPRQYAAWAGVGSGGEG